MSLISRRSLLRGRIKDKLTIRPPWVVSEALFIERCTQCARCIKHCETQIIIRGSGGFPEIDFQKGDGECTFCGACEESCPEQIFSRELLPWHYKANITESCLTYKNIECRCCQDSCAYSAIRFQLQPKKAAQPYIVTENCTGCGACLNSCPTSSIRFTEALPEPINAEKSPVEPDEH